MSWRKAQSIEVLFDEANAASPARNKTSDGTIGDAAHASRDSDHNPWVIDQNGTGVVRAADITHDPDHGIDGDVIARRVAGMLGRHSALGSGAYVIWEARIISADRLTEGWRPYSGSNEHRKHIHISVATARPGYDSTAPWGIFDQEDDDMALSTEAKAQLDRIEGKIDRVREGSFKRDKRILTALDELVETSTKTARRQQVAAIRAMLEQDNPDA